MQAREQALTFLNNEGTLQVPFFQRSYVWDIRNWEELLDELTNEKKNTFLGSLILKQENVASGEHKKALIIDGQQRLTTLSILVKALFDTFSDQDKQGRQNMLYTILYYFDSYQAKKLNKIEHSHIDAQSYNAVMEEQITPEAYGSIVIAAPDTGITSTDSNIWQCYAYFRTRFEQMPETQRLRLFARLLDSNHKMLVVIDLDSTEDEQAIFDTINSAGVRLSGADIIKNALFQRATQLMGQERVIQLYNHYWVPAFSSDLETTQYWSTMRLTGRLLRDNIEILFHSIAVIKGFFDPDTTTLSDVPACYKAYLQKIQSEKELTDFLQEVAEYARLYREKILLFDKSTLFSFDQNEQRLFHLLNQGDLSTFHPYILFLHHEMLKGHISDKQKQQKLYELECFVARNMLAHGETKGYNKLCKELIRNPETLTSKLNTLTDDMVSNGLDKISNKMAALFLFWIELKRRHDDPKESLKELKFAYSLEHIMPQKWTAYWSYNAVPYVTAEGDARPDDDSGTQERNRAVYRLGNMTLLNSSLNTSLRNYTLDKKINGEGRKKGMRNYADLKITKDDIVMPYQNGRLKAWNEASIQQRTRQLAQEILTIWNSTATQTDN